jgi:tetraacyldisaccharide 4'-kinase
MFLLRVFLFPLAVMYDLITRLRNRLYDLRLKPSTRFDIPVIGVGNLAVGGSGKTPMIEYLIRLLRPQYRLATLSRGYGRRTTGVRVAGKSDNADTIGDEPYQLHLKFPEVAVAVGEDRVLAVPALLDESPETAVILLDDAFQHRRIKAGLEILVTEYSRPFYRDYVLPSGRLRESRAGAARAHLVVVTKCPPDLSAAEEAKIRASIARYTGRPVFFAGIRYGQPLPFGGHAFPLRDKVLLVTGIANPEPLRSHISANFVITRHLAFGDHYRYSVNDMERIRSLVTEDMSVLTTEKDRVKLEKLVDGSKGSGYRLPLFYLPIEMTFLKNGEDFDAMIIRTIEKEAARNEQPEKA